MYKKEIFIMSTISTTSFTERLDDTKSSLDRFFRIPIREEANRIIKEMIRKNTDTNKSGLGDLDDKLLKILNNDSNYVADHSAVQPDGTVVAISLFESGFKDLKKNAEIIDEYAGYVNNLKSIVELDKLFLEKLNVVYSYYKSSSDYMSRLVNRLLKYNFDYKDEDIKDIKTRVLILRHFIKVFGYDCVEEISSPELENIVKKEFGGDVEKITDEIFKYIDETPSNDGESYNKEYIDALVKLQGTIIYKSTTIHMTKDLCEEVCSVVLEKVDLSEGDEKTERRILTDEAINGTAKLLKDCFYEPECFEINYFKNYKQADIDRIIALNSKLKSLHTKGKKTGDILYSDIDALIRVSVFICNFAHKVTVSEKDINLLKKAFPLIKCKAGSTLSKCLTEKDIKIVNTTRQYDINKDEKRIAAIKDLADRFERNLDNEDKKAYSNAIYEKIKNRYNGATSPSKKDNLFQKANELLGVDREKYKMLRIADDLANARFSSQGKTREYLYIFAIAFGMTYGCESDEFQNKTNRKDPRALTDIQKNLFFDYYSDNIVNNLRSVSGLSNGNPNVMVDGYGINYKNFAEIAFLWCLEQESMTEQEKLKTAYKIIEYCKKNGKPPESFVNSDNGANSNETLTKKYKKDYFGKELKSVDDIQTFLIKKYPCKFAGNVMKINANGRTAGNEFVRQQERVKELFEIVEADLLDNEYSSSVLQEIMYEKDEIIEFFILMHYLRELKCRKCKRKKGGVFPNCYSFFDEYSWIDKNGKEQKVSSCKEFCANKHYDDETLRKSLRKIIYFGDDYEKYFEKKLTSLSCLCNKNQIHLKEILENIEKKLTIEVLYLNKDEVSRTAIIALCYLEMVLLNYLYRCNNDNEKPITSYETFYKQFCEGRTVVAEIYDSNENKEFNKEFIYKGANKILKEAGYQTINSKNMFDVYVIFLAFKDNYNKLFKQPSASDLIKYAKNANLKLQKMKKEIEEHRKNENSISEDR